MYKHILIGFAAILASSVAFSCDPSKERCPQSPMPDKPAVDMQKQMDQMVPMFGNVAQSMMAGRFAALADPKTTEQLAKFSKRYFDALVAEGFTEEQALRIVVAVGVPSAQ